MNSEALAKKLHGELDRWSGQDEQHAGKTGNILLPRTHDSKFRFEGNGPGEIDGDEEVTDEPPFVKEAPIAIAGPWRSTRHCNFWWVVRHHMMHPCRSEREAEKLCGRLKDDWEEA
jgi:hypothetical protein